MLGLEVDVFRDACLAQTFAIVRPFLRQIQPVRHWQARMLIGNRHRYRDLAVVLLAKLTAILPRNTDRMPALLRQTSIVDNPRFDRAVSLDLRQNHLAHLGQNLLVRPPSLTDKMQQRLVLGGHPRRRRHGGDRFDALALTWQHQPGAIITKRLFSVLVPNHARKPLDIRRKPRFTALKRSAVHPQPLSAWCESRPISDSLSARTATF